MKGLRKAVANDHSPEEVVKPVPGPSTFRLCPVAKVFNPYTEADGDQHLQTYRPQEVPCPRPGGLLKSST